jgi:hypothetical protein
MSPSPDKESVMRSILNTRLRPFVVICLAVSAFAAGFAVSARDVSIQSWYDLCVSRCEQRYQACISSGNLAPAICESNRQGCLAVCNQ